MAGEFCTDLLDRLFDCLANQRRRYALRCLSEHRSMTLADLADEVAVREYDRRIDEIPAEAVMRVYLTLYHTHVPKLESAELAEYRQAEDAVTAGEAIERADPFLTVADGNE